MPTNDTNNRTLPVVVKRLGWLHFANDFTLDFLTPLLPGSVPVAWLGVMEGAADGIAQALKLITGRRSDAQGVRAPWVRAGYATNAVMRPLAAVGIFFTLPVWVVLCRVGDRLGKGIRGSASDALVADWTEGDNEQRARAYASMRTMDHLGATAGGLAAAAAVAVWHEQKEVAWLVAALALPAAAMLWWCRGLSEAPTTRPAARPNATVANGWWPADAGLRMPLLILALACLGSKIGPLLILVQVAGVPLADGGWPLWQICLGWAALGLVQAGAATIAGIFTERLGPRVFLIIGWIAGALLFTALACVSGPWLMAVGLGYGVLAGFTEGAEKTYIAGLAPKHERALAFGALGLLTAAATLIGNAGCGWGLTALGAQVFFLPAIVLVLAAGVLAIGGRRLGR